MNPEHDIPDYLQATFHELVGIIREGLIRDGHVQLYKFGSFKLSWTKPRKQKNKKTGEYYYPKPQPKVVFSPAKNLREQIHPDPEPVIPMAKPVDATLNDRKRMQVNQGDGVILPAIPPVVKIEPVADASNDPAGRRSREDENLAKFYQAVTEPEPKPIHKANPHTEEQRLYVAKAGEQDLQANTIAFPQPKKVPPDGEEAEVKTKTTLPWQDQGEKTTVIDKSDESPRPQQPPFKSQFQEDWEKTRKGPSQDQALATGPVQQSEIPQPDKPPEVNRYTQRELERFNREKEQTLPDFYPNKKTYSKKWVGLLAMVPLIIVVLQAEFSQQYPGMERDPEPQTVQQSLDVAEKSPASISEEGDDAESQVRFAEDQERPPDIVAEQEPDQAETASVVAQKDDKPIPWFNAANQDKAPSVEQGQAQEELQDHYQAPKVHAVARGDNLWTLAERYYDDPYMWPYIYRANQRVMDNPDSLVTGKKIVIPGLQHAPGYASARDRQAVAEGYVLLYEYYQQQNRSHAHYFLVGAYRFHPDWFLSQKRRLNKKDFKRAVFWGGRLVAKEQ